MEEYVYYICYGSNLLEERFLLYIKGGENKELNISQVGCSDKSSPKKTISFELPYSIYFAKESSKWENKGVAFLDISEEGHSYVRGYLITKEQFLEVSKQEGAWYDKDVYLGDYEGYPLFTFTSSEKYKETIPGDAYLNVIKKGLSETFEYLSEEEIDTYLKRRII